MDKYIHLHVHSDYSALDGACSIVKIIDKVKHLGQPAIALTEHGNIDSAFKFSLKCQEAGIKPIHGCEMYFAPLGIAVKDSTNPIIHIVVLCKNEVGWQNLLQLIAIANTDGFYYKPRIDFELLEKHHEGLIILTACLQGPIAYHLRRNEELKATEMLIKFKNIFGDDFYIEVMNHGIPDQQIVLSQLYNIAEVNKVKTVATNDVHYITKEDWEIQELLICENMKHSYYDRVDKRNPQEFYIKTRNQMEVFLPNQNSLDTTLEIADKCTLLLKKSSYILPTTKEFEFDVYVREGKRRYHDLFTKQEYVDRLDKEIEIIKAANLAGYFVTVYDFVRYAKANGVAVGPGRGSAGGSLLAYILGITAIDPIKYNLMFSRFYNAGRRESLPDIDIDFSSKNIHKVFAYIEEKYGRDNICQIGTVNTYAPKGALKAICRTFQVPFQQANEMTDLIDPKAKSLKIELDNNEQVKEKYYNDSTPYSRSMTFRDIYNYAMKLEGLVSHKGVHAAGIVISPVPLRTKIPLRKDKNAQLLVSCWTMDDLEANGLVKFDFLRLDNLDAIEETLQQIGKTIKDIPIDTDSKECQKLYKTLIKTGNVGIFQLSSNEGSKIINRLQPKDMEAIAVGITLNRPGCINSGLHEEYLLRKSGENAITYPHPILESILKDTFGVMIYQEQIIKICMVMAGFTESEADIVRKAMGKKKDKLMISMKEKFIDGSIKNGIDKKKADEIWSLINEFSFYSFNHSHAIGYAHIAYYCAYLKANHTTEYMCSLLNTAVTDQDKLMIYLNECRRIKIKIKPPNINESGTGFVGKKKEILYGLMGVKGLGEETVQNIIKNRPYIDLFDFVMKTGCGAGGLTLLAYSGALDQFGYTRKAIVANAGIIIKKSKLYTKKNLSPVPKLFDIKPDFTVTNIDEYPLDDLLAYEYDVLQAYVSQNPLERYFEWIEKNITDREWGDEHTAVAGYVQTKEDKISKAGNAYMDVTLYTPTKTQRVLFFKAAYQNTKGLLDKSKAIWVKGLQKEDVILADSIGLLTENEI